MRFIIKRTSKQILSSDIRIPNTLTIKLPNPNPIQIHHC